MSSMSFYTKCKRPTHLALLDGKPSHPRDPDFNLLECKDCYGEVEWFDGDTKLVLKWNPPTPPDDLRLEIEKRDAEFMKTTGKTGGRTSKNRRRRR